ncbi:MAG: restriction endonuclease subunit S [Deltaproteobacteria bacterium]|nr:restriction endonuclease subunit S [Deltaproteobacteria bacterium]
MKGLWNIPQIWKWVEIKSLGDVVSGGTPSTKEMSYWGDDINWISPADLTGYTKKTIARGAKSLTHQGLAKSSAKLMPAGSIHFSSRAPIGYVAISSQPLSTNQGFKSLVPAQGVFNEYVYYYLKATKYIAEERASGTTFREISGTAFGKLPLPFPPLPEQHRIVAKIEELFSELDNGIKSLKKAREQLKTYRQAVLKYAFEGKLTKEWRTLQRRAGNPPEPSEKLLERIRKEREKHYQQQIVKWKQAVTEWKANGEKGKKPTRISRPKTLSKLTYEETEIYGELPTSWRWSTFCNVTYKVGDIDHKMPKDFTGGLPYLSTGNLKKDGTIDFANAKTISKEDYKRLSLKIKPERGDIIFPRYGTIGRNILINFNKEFLVSYSCAIIKNIPSLMNGKFIYYYSLSPVIKKEIEKYTVQTTQANIGIASIENFIFPLCSLPEQQAIVQEIESRLSVCDKIEQTVEDSLKKAEALRQSILKKAFAGELTRDWREKHPELITGENSAEKLLEKIKAEKARSTVNRKKTRSEKTKIKVKQ